MATVNELPGMRLMPGEDMNSLAAGQGFNSLDAVVAAGTTQATATQLPAGVPLITVGTAAASTGVRLPTAIPGAQLLLGNAGANTLTVYPTGSDTIAAGSSASISANKASEFFCTKAGAWQVSAGA